MSKMTRSEFVGLGGALAGATVGCGRSGESVATTAPELVVVNARVYTIDSAQPRAEAFAIKVSGS
jgi:hypothetical protein